MHTKLAHLEAALCVHGSLEGEMCIEHLRSTQVPAPPASTCICCVCMGPHVHRAPAQHPGALPACLQVRELCVHGSLQSKMCIEHLHCARVRSSPASECVGSVRMATRERPNMRIEPLRTTQTRSPAASKCACHHCTGSPEMLSSAALRRGWLKQGCIADGGGQAPARGAHPPEAVLHAVRGAGQGAPNGLVVRAPRGRLVVVLRRPPAGQQRLGQRPRQGCARTCAPVL